MTTFSAGMQVSHFLLQERLGSGATGDVFQAEDLFLKRQVALKLLTRAKTAEQQERFLREARLCSSLMHPNIAVVYEAGWHESVPYLVMELIEGEMLSRRIRKGKLTNEQAIRYEIQILDALEEAHLRGIVHRDVKSSNIMITEKDQIKILDFGLAKNVLNKGNQITGPGTVVGTIEFLSPEQARGENPDGRSDLFSAGVVLYHMLTGRLPFERETQVAVFHAILNEDFPQAGTGEALEEVLLKALAKEMSDRYQTADEFRKDLNSVDTSAAIPVIPKTSDKPSIAVLYFEKSFSDNPQDIDYLSLGITEDIITDLSKVSGLSVLSRHAVQRYRDRPVTASEALHDLQVQYALLGKVEKTGSRISVTAELYRNGSEKPVWSNRYESEMQDIFGLQEAFAKSIAGTLQVRLTDSEERSLQQKLTANLQSYEQYLRGRHHYHQATVQDNRLAEQALVAALQSDSNFAEAYSALSEVYVQRFYNWFDRDRIWLARANEVLEKAMSLNDRLPEVHCTRGMLLYLRGEYEPAMKSIQRSIRLDPHYALAHDHSGEIYLHVGELDKAILAFHTELRINGEVIYPYFYLVWIHSLLGDFAIAREVLRQAGQKHSRNPLLDVLAGNLASYSGEFLQAEEHLKEAIRRNESNSFAMARLAVVYSQMNRWPEAMNLAETATEKVDPLDHHAAFDRACVHALKGQKEESIFWLRKAVALGWRCLHHYQKEPNLEAIRSDPEFQALLVSMSHP